MSEHELRQPWASAVLRPARPGDAAAIARVHVDTWRSTYAGLLPDRYLVTMSMTRRAAHWGAAREWLPGVPMCQKMISQDFRAGRGLSTFPWPVANFNRRVGNLIVQTLRRTKKYKMGHIDGSWRLKWAGDFSANGLSVLRI